MIIRNYGLMWDKEHIDFGHKKSSGTLYGIEVGDKRGGTVDFREQSGIYALYDSSFNLLYVGQTGSGDDKLLKRLNFHRNDHLSDRWRYVSWFGIRFVTVKDKQLSKSPGSRSIAIKSVLNHLEAISIAIAEPKMNLQRGKFGESVEHYIQHREKKD